MIASTSLPQHHDAIPTDGIHEMKEVSQADIADLLSEVSLGTTSGGSDASSTQSSRSSKSAEERDTTTTTTTTAAATATISAKKPKKRFLKFRRNSKMTGPSNNNKKKKPSIRSRVAAVANKAKPTKLLQFLQKGHLRSSNTTLLLTDEECDWEASGSLGIGQIFCRAPTGLSTIPETAPLQEPLPEFVMFEKRKCRANRFVGLFHSRGRRHKKKSSDAKKKRSGLSPRFFQHKQIEASAGTTTASADVHPLMTTRARPPTVITPTTPKKARSMTTGSASVMSFSALSGTMPLSSEPTTTDYNSPSASTFTTPPSSPTKKKAFDYKRSSKSPPSSSNKKATVAKATYRRRFRKLDLSRYSAMAIAIFIMGALFSRQPMHTPTRLRVVSKPKKKKKQGEEDFEEWT